MPNTKSAKKALRQSNKKQQHNSAWTKRIKAVVKSIKKDLSTGSQKAEVFTKQQQVLQKVVDKAVKEKVIHRNKANRIKTRYAQKVATYLTKVKNPAEKEK